RPALFVVTAELVDRNDQAARFPRWPQAHVYFVEPAHRSEVAHRLDDPLRQLGEEMKVIGLLVPPLLRFALARRARARPSIPLVNQDQIKVAMVAQLPPAQLAQPEQHVASLA